MEALARVIEELEGLQVGRIDEAEFCRWVEGARDAETGAFTIGYPDYGPASARMWDAFAAAGYALEKRDYRAWAQERWPGNDVGAIAGMDWDDLMLLLTLASRGERFADGYQARMQREGVFLAVARRMMAVRGL